MLISKYVNTNNNSNIYGNALEALMGAIYLDRGYKQCKNLLNKRLFRTFVNLDKVAKNEVNFKSKLIEWCQKERHTPDFILIEEVLSEQKQHVFRTRLTIEGKTICEATGRPKKESQQQVSHDAYQLIRNNPDFVIEITKKAENNTSIPDSESAQSSEFPL
jgi:ribonuclease-3